MQPATIDLIKPQRSQAPALLLQHSFDQSMQRLQPNVIIEVVNTVAGDVNCRTSCWKLWDQLLIDTLWL
jgi:hypothetical protein